MSSDATPHRPSEHARSCAEVATALHLLLDDELDGEGAASIAVHLDACRRCGLDADTYRELKRAIRRCGTIDPEAVERLRAFADRLLTERPTAAS